MPVGCHGRESSSIRLCSGDGGISPYRVTSLKDLQLICLLRMKGADEIACILALKPH